MLIFNKQKLDQILIALNFECTGTKYDFYNNCFRSNFSFLVCPETKTIVINLKGKDNYFVDAIDYKNIPSAYSVDDANFKQDCSLDTVAKCFCLTLQKNSHNYFGIKVECTFKKFRDNGVYKMFLTCASLDDIIKKKRISY